MLQLLPVPNVSSQSSLSQSEPGAQYIQNLKLYYSRSIKMPMILVINISKLIETARFDEEVWKANTERLLVNC